MIFWLLKMIFWCILVIFTVLVESYSAETHTLLIILESTFGEHRKIIDIVPKNPDVKVKVFTLSPSLEQREIDEVCNMERPNLLLDLTSLQVHSETIKKIAHYSYIPTITTTFGGKDDFAVWLRLNGKHENNFLQIKQPADLVPHIVRAIVEHHNYENAVVFYDDTFDMFHKLKVLLVNLKVRHIMLSHLHSNRLQDFNKLQIFNFFIIGTEKTISSILSIACGHKYFNRGFTWYGITLEEEGNIKFQCLHARYVVISPKAIKNRLDVNLGNIALPRLTKEFYYNIVMIATNVAKRIKKSHLKELCIKEESDPPIYIHNLVKESIKENQKKLLNFKYHISTLWTSYAHVEMELNGYLVNENITTNEHIADWSSENISLLTNVGNMEKFAFKIIYRISVAVQEPFLYPDKNSPYNYSGLCIDLIEDIAQRVGFKFELYSPEGKGFRYDFNATIYEVKEGRADIGLGPILTSFGGSSIVDFTIPFYDSVGMLVMMKIPDSSKSLFKIVEVLDLGVWGVLLLFYFITSFLLWTFDKFSPYSYGNNRDLLKDQKDRREFTLVESFWFCLTSVTSLGGGEAPRALSGKIVSGIWWFFGFLIMAFYTANLAAFLTASHLAPNIKSIEDLSRQYTIKYGVIDGSSAMHYFEHLSEEETRAANTWFDSSPPGYRYNWNLFRYSIDYPIEKMYSKMLKFMKDTKAMSSSLEEAIKKVQMSTPSKNYAYIGDASDIKFAVMTNCDLEIVSEEFAKRFYSFAVKSSLKKPLDAALLQLLNERKLEKIQNKWWRDNAKIAKCGSRRFETSAITLQNMVGIFLLFGGGIVISQIISVLNNIYKKKITKFTAHVPK